MANSTVNAVETKVGTGWTIDVTVCNLTLDTAIKDFKVFDDGATMNNADFVKSSATSLLYTGAAILSSVITVIRITPINRVSTPVYRSTIDVVAYNGEINRIHQVLSDLYASGFGTALLGFAGQTFTGVSTFSGGTINYQTAVASIYSGASTSLFQTGTSQTFASGSTQTYAGGSTVTFGNAPVLTTKPNQLTGTGTELVNADWVRQSVRPVVIAAVGGAQSIANNTETTLTFTATSDLDATFTANTTFTVPAGAGGIYQVNLNNFSTSGQCTQFFMFYKKNGGTSIRMSPSLFAAADTWNSEDAMFMIDLAASDTIIFRFLQQNTGALARTVLTGDLIIVKLGEKS